MLDFAVIGAGAIAQQAYIPTISQLPATRLQWVVDRDETRARAVAQRFDAGGYATDERIVGDAVDAAIVATPPRFHADIAERCLREGVHVFTEKPVATSSDRGWELVDISRDQDAHFAISRQLREAPACRLIRSFVRNGSIGEVSSATMRFGDETNWDFASDYRLRADLAWGGVLTDKAPHALDVLMWTFGPDADVEGYRDDSLGGLEANAEIDLAFGDGGIHATVEATADRKISNELCVMGDQGQLVADPRTTSARLFSEDGDETVLRPDSDGVRGRYLPRVGKQLQRFVEAIEGQSAAYVPASAGVRLVEWIESCYARREDLHHPWEEKHLRAPAIVGP